MRRRSTLLVIGALLAATACSPTVPTPRWYGTYFPRIAGTATTVNHIGAWTDDRWFASMSATTTSGGGGSMQLELFPRTAAGGSPTGPPITVPLPTTIGLGGPMGEHVIAVGSDQIEFVRETAGTWALAGSLALPLGYQLSAMTDRWLAARRVPGAPGATGDGEVRLYSIDASGSSVTATLAATVGPDPSWSVELREGFGHFVALDGGVLAVSAHGFNAPTPGAVRIFHDVAGTWTPVQSLGGGSGDAAQFGWSVAVDDGAAVDRLVLAPQSDTGNQVDIYADAGGGFALEQTLLPGPPDPTAGWPELFGYAVAIDGNLLAVTAHAASVPSAQPGHDDVPVGHVRIFRLRSAGWTKEADVPTFHDPEVAGVKAEAPSRLQVAAGHVAVTQFVTPDPPDGCSFPCFTFGFDAWSLDRH